MKKILLFGAGKSATCLIDYLVQVTAQRGWELVVAESNLSLAQSKIGSATSARAVGLNVENEAERDQLVKDADIVISLLPPALHFLAAQSCIRWKRSLLTASYLDDRIKTLEREIADNGLIFLCEMGLDPGIDHMSAMQLIHQIGSQGGQIVSFRSHTGGLVSPESDNNPWHYKISWNPRNVVLAGAAGAHFRLGGREVRRDYKELFADCEEVELDGLGRLAWYPNRDSLSYIPLYGLESTTDFIRTTLRYPAFCRYWQPVVLAGLTDDKKPLSGDNLSFAEWSASITPFITQENKDALTFLGLLDSTPIPPAAKTNADVLQHLLETRLAMQPQDKDMIVMLHEISYVSANPGGPAGRDRIGDVSPVQEIRSSLIVHGEDHLRTAMAKTVGLPLGIAAKLILEGTIGLKGLHIPILPQLYEPVLKELAGQGIRFEESHADAP